MQYTRRSIERRKVKEDCLKYLGQEGCLVCGFDLIEGLTFHHLNPKDKNFNISKNLHQPFHILKKELDKCVCLCKNCHTRLHCGVLYLEEFMETQ
jgi:hypothetical protein